MINNAYLSQDAIETLAKVSLSLTLLSSSETITSKVNLNMQICHNQYNSAFNLNFYCLSDLTHHYSNFLIKKNTTRPLSLNDILNITEVSSYYDGQHSVLIFYIKSYKFIGNSHFSVLFHTKSYFNNEAQLPKAMTPLHLPLPLPSVKAYSLIKDLSQVLTPMSLLIKVKRKSSIIYLKNKTESYFYFEGEDKSKSRLRLFTFGNKNNHKHSNSNSALKSPNPFYSIINVGSYYQIQGEFTELKNTCPFLEDIPEIYLSSQAKVIEMPIDDHLLNNSNMSNSNIDQNRFITIKEALTSPNYLLINILGKVLEIKKIEFEFVNNKPEGLKRMVVSDSSGFKIEVVLWGYFALYHIKAKDILFLEAFQINPHKKDEDMKILATVFESKISINPKTEKAMSLKNFFSLNTIKLKKRLSELDYFNNCFISEIKQSSQGFNSISGKVKLKGFISHIDYSMKNIYEGCPADVCKAPLAVRNMEWHCPKCCKGPISPNYYYRLSVIIQDCSGFTQAILLDHCARNLMQIEAYQYKNYFKEAKKELTGIMSSAKYLEMYFFIKEASMNPIEIFHIEGINKALESQALAYKLHSIMSDKFLL